MSDTEPSQLNPETDRTTYCKIIKPAFPAYDFAALCTGCSLCTSSGSGPGSDLTICSDPNSDDSEDELEVFKMLIPLRRKARKRCSRRIKRKPFQCTRWVLRQLALRDTRRSITFWLLSALSLVLYAHIAVLCLDWLELRGPIVLFPVAALVEFIAGIKLVMHLLRLRNCRF